MDFAGALRNVLRSRGQQNLKRKEAPGEIAINKYGTSLFFTRQLVPSFCDHLCNENCTENKSIVMVVSPLKINVLIDDQLNRLNSTGVSCTSLRLCGNEIR